MIKFYSPENNLYINSKKIKGKINIFVEVFLLGGIEYESKINL
jgi:hypothetical protein